MSVRVRCCYEDLGGHFNEDAPRPPVPGEEGRDLDSSGSTRHGQPDPGPPLWAEGPAATPRRTDLDLGYEPEGSASPTPPFVRWAQSLHSLLDDQDGTQLFRNFLQQEGCTDMLDFWFACSGFRKLPAGPEETRRLKLAKAIYRKFVSEGGGGLVARQIKAATRSFIRDCLLRPALDSSTFDQAQAEIHAMMEENAYPLFLKSHLYLTYARVGPGETSSPTPHANLSPGDEKPLPGCLPPLVEDKEWVCQKERVGPEADDHAPCDRLTQKLLMETASGRATSDRKSATWGFRERNVLVHPYYVNSGCAWAPVTSANDSELQSMSSDADTISLTDSSLDGVPAYRHRKQRRREIRDSARTNGHVPLPHIPRTSRPPKEVNVDPDRFAAELIGRLETVVRERQAKERLEERLKRVRLEEEGDDADVSMGSTHFAVQKLPAGPSHNGSRYPDMYYGGNQSHDTHEENPESILDDHVQRVMKTPGCQSPKSPSNTYKHTYLHTHTDAPLRARNSEPVHHYGSKGRGCGDEQGLAQGESFGNSSKGSTLSRRSGRGKSEDGRGLEGRGPEIQIAPEEQRQQILQWVTEGERESGRQRKGSKKVDASHSGHFWVNGSHRHGMSPVYQITADSSQRHAHNHTYQSTQEPVRALNPGIRHAPNPLCQLEEARRRLEEERRAVQRRHRSSNRKGVCESITVAYYFCDEQIPYLTSVKGRVVTLGQFKELLTKKGQYRFYFKKVSEEFDCGVVFEEVREDDTILPIFEERIVGKVDRVS